MENNKKQLPIYQCIIDENDDDTYFDLISLVDNPAIEIVGVMLSEESEKMMFAANAERKIVTGPALIPNKKILRHSAERGAYFIQFTNESIRVGLDKFQKSGTNRKINFNHTNEIVPGYLLEAWIVEDSMKDKSAVLGFDVPVGTLMVSVKIEDDNFWNETVKGEGFNGFSIEGMFKQKLESYVEPANEFEELLMTLNEFLK